MMRCPSCRHALAGTIALLLAACQGDTTSPSERSDPGGTLSAGEAPAAAPDDTAYGAPATPAPSPSGDTARTTPPAPAPATAIDLTVYVGIASPGVDTLRSTPAANARVAVLSRSFVRSSTGPDTLAVTETLVASGTTDALGKAAFGNLPAANYRIEAVVEGRAGSRASIQIAPPYSSKVAASIIFRPAP
jgi:hypothetical protein